MAYPYQFYPTYPYMQNMQNMQTVQNAPQQATELKWVQGISDAKAYPVAPGNTVSLWDSEASVIYVKSADNTGMPSMKILDYTVRKEDKPANQPILEAKHEYADKEYVDTLSAEIKAIQAEIERFKKTTANKPEKAEKA